MYPLAKRIESPSNLLERTSAFLPPEMIANRSEGELRDLRDAVVLSLATLLDLKDFQTGVHATRLASWARRAAAYLEVESKDLRDIEVACMLHDLGKIGVPESILRKTSALNAEEYEEVKKHPSFGWTVLRLLPGFETVANYVLYHHERWDGGGYPAGLEGEEIPVGSRIVAVVDAFDAMISPRAYKLGLPIDTAIAQIRSEAGTQFDPRVAETFIRVVEDSRAEFELARVPANWPSS